MVFEKIFGRKPLDEEKLNAALEYFFALSRHLLNSYPSNPNQIGVKEVSEFREQYLTEKTSPQSVFSFYSKIEGQAISFTQYHVDQKRTFLIGAATEPELDMSNPTVREVSQFLQKIL